ERRAARLVREAQAMAKIAHPNVISVFDVGSFDDQVFIAMELVDGPSLRVWLETPRSTREIVAVFAQAGRGLEAAHGLGLVHRDFKPDNVLVSKDGRVLVTDFGVVGTDRDAAPEGPLRHPLTQAGAVVGTPRYMAPEQRGGGAVDGRADQYAFCRSLAEALEGKQAPRALRALIDRGTAGKPDDRFPSMAALLEALAPRPRRRAGWIAAAIVVAGAGLIAFGRTPTAAPVPGLEAHAPASGARP